MKLWSIWFINCHYFGGYLPTLKLIFYFSNPFSYYLLMTTKLMCYSYPYFWDAPFFSFPRVGKHDISTHEHTHPCIPFLVNHVLKSWYHLVGGEGSKSETGAAGLQGRNDLGKVITDQAETNILCVLLDNYNKHRVTMKNLFHLLDLLRGLRKDKGAKKIVKKGRPLNLSWFQPTESLEP